MKVNFKRAFFSSGCERFRKGKNVEVPEKYRDELPSSAVIVDNEKIDEVAENVVEVDELKEADLARAQGEAENEANGRAAQKLEDEAAVKEAEEAEAAALKALEAKDKKPVSKKASK